MTISSTVFPVKLSEEAKALLTTVKEAFALGDEYVPYTWRGLTIPQAQAGIDDA